MAHKPLRPCRHPGCPELTRDGYCPEHHPKKARGKASASWRWMYRTKTWTDELRPSQLLREPFCRECAKHGRRTPGVDVDHIEPHRGDWAKFTDPENLQTLCHGCHSRKTLAEIRESSSGSGVKKR